MRVPVTRKRLISAVLFAIMSIFVLVAASDCGDSATNENREKAVSGRDKAFDRATSLYPDPVSQVQNFPLREALVKMTLREDEIKPWYVYILGDNGNVIGYYVAQTVPINGCNFLSSSEDIWTGSEGRSQIVQAPSLDGMFYGNAECNTWVFFDQATDAMVKISNVDWYVSDQQLIIDAEEIKVAAP